jgi:hypothetical protein
MNRSALRAAIVVLGLITALVHLVVLNILLIQDGQGFSLLFALNGLGYLGLLAAFLWPVPFFSTRRRLLHYAFMGYAVLTILAWIPAGSKDFVGFATKLDEVLLIAALAMNLRNEA